MIRSVRRVGWMLYIVLCCISTECFAQAQPGAGKLNYAGKDFWFALNVYADDFFPTQSLFHDVIITSARNTYIELSFLRNNTTRQFSLSAGTVLKIRLTDAEVRAISSLQVEVASRSSLHITSDEDIIVQYVAWGAFRDDGTLILPSDKQSVGHEYYLNGCNGQLQGAGLDLSKGWGGFTFVAACDSVELEIIPTQLTLSRHAAGIPFTIVLNKGESYVLACRQLPNGQDLSGTRVTVKKSTCCNPLNVFLSYPAAAAWDVTNPVKPQNPCCVDLMMEQILPVAVWDTVYTIVPFRNNALNNIKIVSASNNNAVRFDGQLVKVVNQGLGFDTIIDRPVVISSQAPVSINEFMMSQYYNNPDSLLPDSLSDPDALWILPLRDGITETYFQTNGQSYFSYGRAIEYYTLHVLTIISKTENVPFVKLNNSSLSNEFRPFPGNADYMYAYLKVDTGVTHHLESADRVIAYYFGAGETSSATYNLGDIYNVPPPYYNADSFAICINDTVTLSGGRAQQYLWSNGDTTESIAVYDPGFYYVIKSSDNNCIGETKAFYVDVTSYDIHELNDTLLKCRHEQTILTATPGASSLLWYSGSTEGEIEVTSYGDAYRVIETFQPDCLVQLHDFTVLPRDAVITGLDIGNDTVICTGDNLVLKSGWATTSWSTGLVAYSIAVDTPGIYFAAVRDTCLDITYRDTIVVSDKFCPDRYCNLFLPSAFSPNGDGINDLFRPIAYGAIAGYLMNIYNRWGEMIYQVRSESKGWDGTHNGIIVDGGVYYYRCSYDCLLKGNAILKGEVTLIR